MLLLLSVVADACLSITRAPGKNFFGSVQKVTNGKLSMAAENVGVGVRVVPVMAGFK